jgi:ligand-binding sensor domain-containing protein/AraC-like DNA-binding protein
MDFIARKKSVGLIAIFVILVALSFCGSIYAQNYSFIHYSVDDGLAGSYVNKMIQDSDGYLWIATVNGVSRFDGTHFENFYKEDGLPGNFSVKLFADSRNRVWISILNAGLAYYFQNNIHTVVNQHSTPGRLIFEDSKQQIWFTVKGDIFRFTGNRLQQMTPANGFTLTKAHAVAMLNDILYLYSPIKKDVFLFDEKSTSRMGKGSPINFSTLRMVFRDSKGDTWFGLSGKLIRFDGKQWQTFLFPGTKKGIRVTQIVEDKNGVLWVGTLFGLFKLNSLNLEYINFQGKPVDARITALVCDRSNHLWFGTNEGLYSLKHGNITRYTHENGLINRHVTDIFEDREGNIWIGTTSVLTVLKSPEIEVFDQQDGLVENLVWGIAEDGNGGYWVCTNSGVSFWDGSGLEQIKGNGLLINRRVFEALKDTKGNTWFVTSKGVVKYDGQKWSSEFLNYIQGRIQTVFQANDGALWFGSARKGVLRVIQGKVEHYHSIQVSKRASQSIQAFWDDGNGRVLLGGNKGVWEYHKGKINALKIGKGIDNKFIFSLYRDSKGTLWICTHKGLFGWKEGKLSHFTTKEGLSDNQCYYTREDKEGNLWIGTNRGLDKFNGERFQVLNAKMGLSSSEMNMGAVLMDSRQNLWVGTINGVSKIDLTIIRDRKTAPKIDITNMTIDDKDLIYKQNKSFRFNQNDVKFNYRGIYLYSPTQIEYDVKLAGIEEDWHTTRGMEAFYPNLPAGDYVFMVRARHRFENSQSDIKSILFTIQKRPFWLNPWIWFAVLLLFGLNHFIIIIVNRKKLVLQKQIFQQIIEEQKKGSEDISSIKEIVKNKEKYTNLTQEEADKHLATFLDMMKSKKLYMEPSLDIKTVALEMDISPRNLSEVINRELQQRFSNLINQYRVEEAKVRIRKMDKKEVNILNIAFDVGFNSKSSFNAIFKKYENLTPSQYYQQAAGPPGTA